MTAGLACTVVDLDAEDREAWLTWRRGGIGASEAAALLGLSPWASPLSVYADKIDPDPPVDDDSEWLRWGQLLEPPILDEFAHRTGFAVGSRQLCVESIDHPVMRATVDGVAYTTDGRPAGVVEVKVTGDRPWDEPPVHYEAQVAWQLAVTGLRRGWLVSLHNARQLVIHEIDPPDPDLVADLVALAVDFWQRVVDRRPPPVDGHDATTRALGRLYPGDPDTEPVVVPETLIAELTAARDATKHAKDAQTAVENELKALMGDATVAEIAGTDGTRSRVATWKPHLQRDLDQAAVWAGLGTTPDDPYLPPWYRPTSPRRPLRLT